MDRPTIPGLNVFLPNTDSSDEKKIIKPPIISNLTASHLE